MCVCTHVRGANLRGPWRCSGSGSHVHVCVCICEYIHICKIYISMCVCTHVRGTNLRGPRRYSGSCSLVHVCICICEQIRICKICISRPCYVGYLSGLYCEGYREQMALSSQSVPVSCGCQTICAYFLSRCMLSVIVHIWCLRYHVLNGSLSW